MSLGTKEMENWVPHSVTFSGILFGPIIQKWLASAISSIIWERNCLSHKVTVKMKSNSIFRASRCNTVAPFSISYVQSQGKISKEIKATSIRKTQTGWKPEFNVMLIGALWISSLLNSAIQSVYLVNQPQTSCN